MDLEKENKELKERLKFYEDNPIAGFYVDLTEAAQTLRTALKDCTLDLKDDVYQISVFMFLKDADKIFTSMEKGREAFMEKKVVDKKKAISLKAHTGVSV